MPASSVSTLRDLARLAALGPAERRLLVRALFLYGAFTPGVRVAGLRKAQGWFTRLGPIPGATQAQATRVVSALVRRSPWRGTCLAAALTLRSLLAAQGIASEVRLGVRRLGGRVEAHAWLERDGVALFDPGGPSERFEALEPVRSPR
jgi:hypothetical protein